MPLPAIRTERILLRPWTLEDVDVLHSLWTAPEVRRYLWDDAVIARDVAQEIVENHLRTADEQAIGYWAIQVPPASEAQLVGFCGFRFIDDGPDIELMYGLRGECWGKGFATESCSAILDYLWRGTDFARVYARADPPNARSVDVMCRLGMTHLSTTESTITYVLHRPA